MSRNSITNIFSHLDSLGSCILLFQEGILKFINAYGTRLIPDLSPGLPLSQLLPEDVTLFQDGITLLPVTISGMALDAKITPMPDYTLMELSESREALSRSAMRTIADSLLEPITSIRVLTPKLLPQLVDNGDSSNIERAAQLNKSLCTLYRAVNNIRLSGNPISPKDLRIKQVNVTMWLENLVHQLHPICKSAQRSFTYSLPSGDFFCWIDCDQMERAIYNLISNAVKYTLPQGRVELSAAKTSGGRIRITVRDNGCGIPPYKMCNLFQIKEQTAQLPDPREGIGLGLPLAKSILTAHEGTLMLESREGSGTSVHLFLPMCGHQDSYPLHSDVLRPDYSGSFPPILLELSDVLPVSMFDTRSLDL